MNVYIYAIFKKENGASSWTLVVCTNAEQRTVGRQSFSHCGGCCCLVTKL